MTIWPHSSISPTPRTTVTIRNTLLRRCDSSGILTLQAWLERQSLVTTPAAWFAERAWHKDRTPLGHPCKGGNLSEFRRVC